MKEQKNNERVTNVAKVFMMIFGAFSYFMADGYYCLAAGNIGQSAGQWVLDQLFWVALVVLAIALITCLIKKAWVAAVIIIVAGGLILVFIKDPKLIEGIGNAIKGAMGL